MKNTAPIFILGTPRSGTTLLAKILGRHSRIHMPGETHFFGDIHARRKELGDPGNPAAMEKILERLSTLYGRYNEPEDQKNMERLLFGNPGKMNELKQSCRSYRDILSFFMATQTRHAKKKRWGNNAPRDLFDIDSILSFYPDAKIIICTRDIRDYLLSYKNRSRHVPPEHARRLERTYHPVVTSFLWKTSARSIPYLEHRVPAANRILVQYENLAKHPARVVEEVCGILEEPFEPEMLAVDFHNSSAEIRETGIFSSSIGRWRQALDTDEAAVAQFIAAEELRHLGYDTVKLSPSATGFLKLFLTAPIALLRGLSAGKNLRAPLVPYVCQRLVSFARGRISA